MPVTAKLSKLFYERLGEQIANEIVEWFNSVDATYRSDLREFNELNFARFDAKLEQRLSEFGARFDLKLEQRLSEVNQRFAEMKAEMNTKFSDVRADVAALRAELIKWMFLFWAGTALAGLLFR